MMSTGSRRCKSMFLVGIGPPFPLVSKRMDASLTSEVRSAIIYKSLYITTYNHVELSHTYVCDSRLRYSSTFTRLYRLSYHLEYMSLTTNHQSYRTVP